ncbi:MAG: glycosyltransferase [Verrucomicrobiae bacterium]|nr:glycosyltransferase [Verrucomicrobiae bacterium]
MRVVWVNRSEWRKPGPIVYIGLLNARSFAVAGHEVDFFCAAGSHSDTRGDLAEFYGLDCPENLAIHRVEPGSKLSENFGRRVYREAMAQVRRYLDAGEDVLLLTRELGLTPYLARLQHRFPKNLRTVYEAHDFHADLSGRDAIDFNDRRKQFTERWALPRLSGVLAITSEQADLYRQALPGLDSLVQPLGCLEFPDSASPEVLRARRTIVYIGHLHREKGVPQLLKHERWLSDRKLRLQIIGGEPDRVAQLDRKRKLAGESPIEILPMMPPARLHPHLAQHAGAGLVPLEDNFYNRYLTCPVKALDSMAHGLPVIASDLESTRGVLGAAGCFVPPGDGDAIRQAISDLFEDAAKFERLANAATERARDLGWRHRAETIARWAWAL